MNVARWTPLPGAEHVAAAELRELARRRRNARGALFLVSVSIPFTCLLLALGPLAWVVWVAVVLGLVRFASSVLRRHEEAGLALHRRDVALVDEFGKRHGWLVELMVHRGATPTGTDRGMLWIEDDRLYFSGDRTSFGLSPFQVEGRIGRRIAVPGLFHGLSLRLRGVPGLGISFAPVSHSKDRGVAETIDVQEEVERWLARSRSTEGQLPPLEFGPGAPPKGQLLRRALLAIGYWPLLTVVFLALIDSDVPVLAVLVAMAGLMVGALYPPLWVPWVRLQAWRDRRTLEGRW